MVDKLKVPDHEYDGFLSFEGRLYRALGKKLIKYNGDIYYRTSYAVAFGGPSQVASNTILKGLEAVRPERVVSEKDGVEVICE